MPSSKKTQAFNLSGNNYLYLLMLSFVLIALSALTMDSVAQSGVRQTQKVQELTYQLVPTISDDAKFPILSAQSVYVVDLDSSESLYEKNVDEKFLPASTTKIMTALIALENFDKEDVIKVGRISVEGQKMGLYLGEEVRAMDLINALLVYSANDAAEALASGLSGGRKVFVQKMNEKAVELGLSSSNFTNPSGLDGVNHLMTARDLYTLSKYAMQNPEFAKIVSQQELSIKSVDERFVYKLDSTNELLGEVDGVLGVKTGYTDEARENLVTYIERDGKKLIMVVLASQDRFGETKELIDWVFENYEWRKVAQVQE